MRPPEMMTEACCPSSRVMVFMLVPTGIPLSPFACLSAGAGLAGLLWARDMLWGAASVVMVGVPCAGSAGSAGRLWAFLQGGVPLSGHQKGQGSQRV